MSQGINFANKVIKEEDILITKQIGRGNWSTVYEAYNLSKSQKYAVKIIKEEVFEDLPKISELTRAQINILKQCSNPHVVKYIKSFSFQRYHFTVLQYLDGGDLGQKLMKYGALPEALAVSYLKQILDGFKGLHQVRAMHRDFKVENVMIHNQDICKIVDLGFGKQMKDKVEDVTATKLGSNLTMAPEVMLRKPYSFKADIWSIGIVYYQLLQNKFPFIGRNEEAILKQIQNEEINFTRTDINEQSIDFILKCLVMDVNKRINWQEIYKHPLILNQKCSYLMLDEGSYVDIHANFSFYEEKTKNKQFRPFQIYSFINKEQDIHINQQQNRKKSMEVSKNKQQQMISRHPQKIKQPFFEKIDISQEKNQINKQELNNDKISQIRSKIKQKQKYKIHNNNINIQDHQSDKQKKKLSVHQKWQMYKNQYNYMIEKQRYKQDQNLLYSHYSQKNYLDNHQCSSNHISNYSNLKPMDQYEKQQKQIKKNRIPIFEQPKYSIKRQQQENHYQIRQVARIIKKKYYNKIKDSIFSLFILQKYYQQINYMQLFQNQKYLCILLKDSYKKINDLIIQLKNENNIFCVSNEQFKQFNQIYKSEICNQCEKKLQELSGYFKNLNIWFKNISEADKFYLSSTKITDSNLSQWRKYLIEQIRNYWIILTHHLFKNPQIINTESLTIYIFCLRQFQKYYLNFDSSKLYKILIKFQPKKQIQQLYQNIMKKYNKHNSKSNKVYFQNNVAQKQMVLHNYQKYPLQYDIQPNISYHKGNNYLNRFIQNNTNKVKNNYHSFSLTNKIMWRRKQQVSELQRYYKQFE